MNHRITLSLFVCFISLAFVSGSFASAIDVITSPSFAPTVISPNDDLIFDETTFNTEFHLEGIAGFHGWSVSQSGNDKREFSIVWSMEIRGVNGTVVRILNDTLPLEPADPDSTYRF